MYTQRSVSGQSRRSRPTVQFTKTQENLADPAKLSDSYDDITASQEFGGFVLDTEDPTVPLTDPTITDSAPLVSRPVPVQDDRYSSGQAANAPTQVVRVAPVTVPKK